MLIDGIKVVADNDISYAEIEQIVAEEKALWEMKSKTLSSVTISIEGDELVIKAVERSPIKRLRRISGYLADVDAFNDAKHHELLDRVNHF